MEKRFGDLVIGDLVIEKFTAERAQTLLFAALEGSVQNSV
jgi:hypothetical protein